MIKRLDHHRNRRRKCRERFDASLAASEINDELVAREQEIHEEKVCRTERMRLRYIVTRLIVENERLVMEMASPPDDDFLFLGDPPPFEPLDDEFGF